MNKKNPDIKKIFGVKDFIDKKESEANCLLCFTTFPLNDSDEHIASDYHKILKKATEKIVNTQDRNPKECCSSNKKTDQKLLGKENAPPISKDESNKEIRKNTNPERVTLGVYMKTCRVYLLNQSILQSMGFLFNEEIFIDNCSYYMFKQVGHLFLNHIYCLRCDIDSNLQHLAEVHFGDNCLKTVIINMAEEFIREIKPNKFHCGFCNVFKFGWEEMAIHLKSKKHECKREHSKMQTYKIKNNIGDIQVVTHMFGRELDFFNCDKCK